jgi:hypothetical protein
MVFMVSKKIIIGIDGGQNGAIVIIDSTGHIISKTLMPVIKSVTSRTEYDIVQIKLILKQIQILYNDHKIIAGLERVQITPVAGKNAVASMFLCYGIFQGILSALDISYQVFRAVDWQKEILMGIAGTDTKQKSIIWCKRKYPNESFKATERCTKDHDGICDALCIANYSNVKVNINE